MSMCWVSGCDRVVGPKSARGLCSKHYQRWLRHGDSFEQGHLYADRGAGEAFLRAHVNHDGSECLIWPYGRNLQGYGEARVGGVLSLASRHMCRLAHGEPPMKDADAAHSCGMGSKGCVHPKHLRWATHHENEADKVLHGTRLRGEGIGNSKLKSAQVLEIYSAQGFQREIAEKYGCAQTLVSQIKRGRIWAHVTGHRD